MTDENIDIHNISVEELQEQLVILDPSDPSKYDYALFGIGLNPHWLDKKWILNNY